MDKLGVIAGAGALPRQIVAACRESGRAFCVLAFEGSADSEMIGDVPIQWIKMSSLSAALDAARNAGVTELVLVGKIPRPNVSGSVPQDPRYETYRPNGGRGQAPRIYDS